MGKDDASGIGDAGEIHHHECDKEFSLTLQALDGRIVNFFYYFDLWDTELCKLKCKDFLEFELESLCGRFQGKIFPTEVAE